MYGREMFIWCPDLGELANPAFNFIISSNLGNLGKSLRFLTDVIGGFWFLMGQKMKPVKFMISEVCGSTMTHQHTERVLVEHRKKGRDKKGEAENDDQRGRRKKAGEKQTGLGGICPHPNAIRGAVRMAKKNREEWISGIQRKRGAKSRTDRRSSHLVLCTEEGNEEDKGGKTMAGWSSMQGFHSAPKK